MHSAAVSPIATAIAGPDRYELARQIVSAALPGIGFATLPQASGFLGVAVATIRHQLARGIFPVKTATIGGRRVVPIVDLIEYVANPAPGIPLMPPPVPEDPSRPRSVTTTRRRGRPTNAERMAAAAAKAAEQGGGK